MEILSYDEYLLQFHVGSYFLPPTNQTLSFALGKRTDYQQDTPFLSLASSFTEKCRVPQTWTAFGTSFWTIR